MKALLLIMLGGVLVNNYALEKFLGVGPVLGGRKYGSAAMGFSVAAVMLLAAAVTWPLYRLLVLLGAEYLETLIFVLVVLLVVYVLGAMFAKSGKPVGAYFPLVALNSAVLGLAVNNITEGYTYVEALFAALGAGLGFVLAMVLFAGVKSKINERYVPKAFRGLPVMLLAASIISLAFYAFK
ncbi:MAG: Rnf-Nqr domain containing protein [Oscillospiraceae bacterium]